MVRPLIIGVGGAHSGSGKTAYASLLLRRLRGWGAIKYTKTGLYASLVDDQDILAAEGKDTKIMLDSGAERVLWVQAPPSELAEVLPLAVEKLSDLRGIIVEGNSAIEFLKPDIILFIFGKDSRILKGSAEGILEKADALVFEGEPAEVMRGNRKGFLRSPDGDEGLLLYITEMVETKEKIRALVQERSGGGKLPCAVARQIAEELKVPYKDVGDVCNELGIKISDCGLGCF